MNLTIPTRDAVVQAINAAGLVPNVTAVAIYEVTYGLEDLQSPRVAVVPQTLSPKLLTRGAAQRRDVTIDVAVQYKSTTLKTSEIDPYLEMAESIPDLFAGKPLSIGGPTKVVCLEARWPHGLFVQDHLKDFLVFTAVTSLVFTVNQ